MSVQTSATHRTATSVGTATLGLLLTLVIAVAAILAFLLAPLVLFAAALVAYLVLRPRPSRTSPSGPSASPTEVPHHGFGSGAS